MNRVQLKDALVPLMGFEETAYAFDVIDNFGSFPFDRHHANGTDHYIARSHGQGEYSLEKHGLPPSDDQILTTMAS